MGLRRRIHLASIVALTMATLAISIVACGADDDPSTTAPAGGYGMTEEQWNGLGGADGAAGPAATAVASAPTPTVTPRLQPTPRPPSFEDNGTVSDSSDSVLDNQVAQVAQERIIVRNVDMAIEVPDIPAAINQIGVIATTRGGWVVKTQHSEVYRGTIDIRVPAERLDEAVQALRQVATNVRSEISTSQDFTEEFTDANARIRTLQDTVDALRVLFDRAEEIEDALEIQREITRIQSDLEALQARVNFISQSAAFSLVKVSVEALPEEIQVTAGEDILAAAGRSVRFRAEFTPPEGIENFSIEWDFGDGSGPVATNRVAPLNTEGRLISAPVNHTYNSEEDSPYIVKVTVRGTGNSGAIEGKDVVVVTVNRVPPIEVSAGNNLVAEEGKKVKFRGTFTRPEGVQNLTYTWDFGDGSAPLVVESNDDTTVAEAEHTYANSRPELYNVVLTVKGQTPAGSTEGTDRLTVHVVEPQGFTGASFEPGDTVKSAVRVLTSIASTLGEILIFAAILSPLWIILVVAGFIIYRMSRNGAASASRPSRAAVQSDSTEHS